VRLLTLRRTIEGAHFGDATLQVDEKNFIGVQKDGTVTLSLGQARAAAAVTADPRTVTGIRRKDMVIGIEVDRGEHLAGASSPAGRAILVAQAWSVIRRRYRERMAT